MIKCKKEPKSSLTCMQIINKGQTQDVDFVKMGVAEVETENCLRNKKIYLCFFDNSVVCQSHIHYSPWKVIVNAKNHAQTEKITVPMKFH